MEKTQTAVEWLVETLNNKIDYIPIKHWDYLREIIQQAKEMEKAQKIAFANNYGFDICGYDYEKAEQYYNETYGSKD